MSLADRPALKPTSSSRYRVDELREAMPAEDAEIMDRYLHDAGISADRVSRELTDAGYAISVGAICTYRYKVLNVGQRSR